MGGHIHHRQLGITGRPIASAWMNDVADFFHSAKGFITSTIGGGLLSATFSFPSRCTSGFVKDDSNVFGQSFRETCTNLWGGTPWVPDQAQSFFMSTALGLVLAGIAYLVSGGEKQPN